MKVWSNALESSRKLKLSLSRITRLCQQRSWSHTQSAGGLPGAEPWATTGCSRPLCCPRLSRALPHRHCHGWMLPENTDTAWMPGGREKHHSRWGWEGEAQLCAEFRPHWVPTLSAQSSMLCLRLGTNRDTPRRPRPHAASANQNTGAEPSTGCRSFMGSWAPFLYLQIKVL